MQQQCRIQLLALLGFALSGGSSLSADGPGFTQLDFPGAASTQAWGINASGDIVGAYVSADTSTHGFLRTRGEFISIDFPGAVYTYVNGVSPRGDIVGQYSATLNGSGPNHAFVLTRDGMFKTVDFPGGISSLGIGMNSRGDVLGSYSNSDNLLHTYVMNVDPFSPSGQFKGIDDPPNATQAVAIGIRGDDIVGGYPSGSDRHGFLLADGQYTTIDVPGASFTNVTGIDSRGQMVGRYTLNGVTHGYFLSGGQITSFDFPDSILTGATAISPNGDIVGRFQDAGKVFHGFLLTGLRPVNQCAGIGQ
jgi:uncharacterized membrane protein